MQVFWNTMVVELALLAVLHAPSEPGEGISPIKMAIEGLIVVGPCAACAVLTRLVFRWANCGRSKVRLKGERPIVTRRAVDFCVMETADDFADAADIDAPPAAAGAAGPGPSLSKMK